jgi:hypothetical protein
MSRFVPNRNLDKELQATPEYRKALVETMEPAAKAAKAFAPVRTGDYRDSITVDPLTARLQASDWKSNWIEYGTSKWHAHAPVRRGARVVGRFREEPHK